MGYFTRRPKNICEDCHYTWHPRGKNVSLRCPNCNSRRVDVDLPPPTTSCGTVAAAIALSLLGIAAFGCCVGTFGKMLGLDKDDGPDQPTVRTPEELVSHHGAYLNKVVTVSGTVESEKGKVLVKGGRAAVRFDGAWERLNGKRVRVRGKVGPKNQDVAELLEATMVVVEQDQPAAAPAPKAKPFPTSFPRIRTVDEVRDDPKAVGKMVSVRGVVSASSEGREVLVEGKRATLRFEGDAEALRGKTILVVGRVAKFEHGTVRLTETVFRVEEPEK